MDKEGYYTYETKRTNERIGCASERITLWDGYYEGRKDDRYDLRGFTDDEIYNWILTSLFQVLIPKKIILTRTKKLDITKSQRGSGKKKQPFIIICQRKNRTVMLGRI